MTATTEIILAQAEAVYDNLRSSGNGKSFLYDRLYLDSYPLEVAQVWAPSIRKRPKNAA